MRGAPLPACSVMCDRVEAAFRAMWQRAGLGPLPEPPPPAAAAATPRAASAPRAAAAKQQQPRDRQQGGGKRAAAATAGKQGGGGGRSARKRAAPAAAPPSPPSPASELEAQAPTAKRLRPDAPLEPPPGLDLLPAAPTPSGQLGGEEGEEGRELERLLSGGGGGGGAAAAADAADAFQHRSSAPSPLIWDAPRLGGDSGPFNVAAVEAAVAAVDGQAAATAVPPPPSADAFAAEWQAASARAASAAAAAGAVGPDGLLLDPAGGPDALPRHLSLPPEASPAAVPPPFAAAHSLPPALSGLVAATASLTPEQLQQEQSVLAAWRELQERREEAAAAAAAATEAAAALAAAREVRNGGGGMGAGRRAESLCSSSMVHALSQKIGKESIPDFKRLGDKPLPAPPMLCRRSPPPRPPPPLWRRRRRGGRRLAGPAGSLRQQEPRLAFSMPQRRPVPPCRCPCATAASMWRRRRRAHGLQRTCWLLRPLCERCGSQPRGCMWVWGVVGGVCGGGGGEGI
jgi:hypothetical protein